MFKTEQVYSTKQFKIRQQKKSEQKKSDESCSSPVHVKPRNIMTITEETVLD